MRKGTTRLATLALCGLLAVSGAAALVVPAVAVGECTCEITVHSSNCPISRCTCGQSGSGEHADGCALSTMNADLGECVCEPSIHALGCPRYRAEGEILEDLAETDSDASPNPDEESGVNGENDADSSDGSDGIDGAEGEDDGTGADDATEDNSGTEDPDSSDSEVSGDPGQEGEPAVPSDPEDGAGQAEKTRVQGRPSQKLSLRWSL